MQSAADGEVHSVGGDDGEDPHQCKVPEVAAAELSADGGAAGV